MQNQDNPAWIQFWGNSFWVLFLLSDYMNINPYAATLHCHVLNATIMKQADGTLCHRSYAKFPQANCASML